jgi:dolichyl-phosphate-mannose--protein O-mannosyl transferase
MNTFGWRIVGTLTGVIMIPIMYLFGKKLFQKRFYAFCSAFLMMFDLMHFAQTRLATIDSYTALFVMLMYYFMTDYYLQKSYQKGFYKSLKPLFLKRPVLWVGGCNKVVGIIRSAPGWHLFSSWQNTANIRIIRLPGARLQKKEQRMCLHGLISSCRFICGKPCFIVYCFL